MGLVQFAKLEGEVRVPVGERPSFLQLEIEDDREIVSIEWRTPFFESRRRKTVDWRYTVWTAWRAK